MISQVNSLVAVKKKEMGARGREGGIKMFQNW